MKFNQVTTNLLKRTIQLGKVDGYGNGRNSCALEVEVEIARHALHYDPPTTDRPKVYTTELEPVSDYVTVSIQAVVWNHLHTEWITGGQMRDDLLFYLDTPFTRRLVELWDRYHLNEVQAGTTAQQKIVDKFYALPFPSPAWDQWRAGQALPIHKEHGPAKGFEVESLLSALKAQADRYSYEQAYQVLDLVGRRVDRGYTYGSKWLVQMISDDELTDLLAFFSSEPDQPSTPDLIDQVEVTRYTDLGRQTEGNFKDMTGVRVTLSYQGRSASFDWFAGDAHLQGRVLRPDARTVIGSLVDDLSYAEYDVDQLCAELGFKPSEAQKITKKLSANRARLERLFGDDLEQLIEN